MNAASRTVCGREGFVRRMDAVDEDGSEWRKGQKEESRPISTMKLRNRLLPRARARTLSLLSFLYLTPFGSG